MLKIIERAHENEDHLFVELNDIVPYKEDDGAEFTSNGNCVLSVQNLVLFCSSFRNQALVDYSRFNRGTHLNEDLSIFELSIIETLNSLSRHFTDPVEEVLLCFRSDDLQVVESYELPNDSKNVLFVRVTNIFRAKSGCLASNIVTSFKSNLTIDAILEKIVWFHVNS